ncbi:MAG: MFS transporter [Candidatus Leucobacter sulfamidivorax]|nr:MFS transporter [Candidatus Leucobacter sulfamidivorax]
MGIYRDLGRNPGVYRILLAQLTARVPFGMLTIILLLHIQLVYGNYTSAGIILAALSIGQAISGPLSSRLMGVLGMRRVLIVTTLISAAMLILVALTRFPLPLVACFSLLIGLTTPPIMPAVRAIYPKLVPDRQVTALFSLDATAQEIIWVVGPVLAVFVSTQISTAWGLLVAAAFLFGGGLWFVLSPELGRVRLPKSRGRLGAVLTRPTVIVSTVIGFFFVASFTSLEAGIVSVYGHDSIESGIVLAVFSVGSIMGGLTLGHREIRPQTLLVRTLMVTAGTALCLISQETWWLCIAGFLAGIGVAPALAALFTIVSATIRFSETAEAYGWLGTGHLVGAAAGSAVAGIVIDLLGPAGGILVAVGFLIATVAAAAVTVPWVPDLRGRSADPIADTEPIGIPDAR